MRGRLLTVLGVLFVVSIVGFSAALAQSLSSSRTQELVLERNRDLDYMSRIAESVTPWNGGEVLQSYVSRYHELYGDTAVVTDQRGVVFASAGSRVTDPRTRHAVESALRDEAAPVPDNVHPWGPDHAVFTHPVGLLSAPQGAVVILASTDAVRSDVRRMWLYIAVAACLVILLFMGGAVLVSRWILRPLDTMSNDLVELSARFPGHRASPDESPDDESGPIEFRRLRRSFDVMSETVVDAVASQQKITADAAHQLRNPLAALQLRLDSVSMEVPEHLRPELESAANEVERLSSLLSGMLTLAELENSALSREAEATSVCNVDEVIKDRVDAWHESFVQAGMTLTTAPGIEPLVGAISAGSLAQILDVALSNSVKYAGAGAVATISARSVGQNVCVTVTDTGVGFSADVADQLTERFFRTPNGGSGLGLSIASALAEMRGGSVVMSPAEPHGATFTLTVPVCSKVTMRR